MKITKAEALNAIDIELEDGRSYRRYNATDWDMLLGDSWESLYDYERAEELEKAYQEFRQSMQDMVKENKK